MKPRIDSIFLFFPAFFFVVSAAAGQTQQSTASLDVDLRDAPKHIFHARLTMPVKPGPITLVYPKWIPGEHSPTGPIADLVGLKITGNGKEVSWRRDDVDMYAFHIDVPAGTDYLDCFYDYLSPAEPTSSREPPSSTAKFAILNWYMVTLYPQGPKTDELTYTATLRLPPNWKYGTALPVARETADAIEFAPASLSKVIDSPVIAGLYLRHIDLSPGETPPHAVHVVADGPGPLEATSREIQALRQLVAETGALFGARHYRRYDFLLTLSDRIPPDGVEHHESSDDRTEEGFFREPELFQSSELLSHEFTHSWNGKYRRPVGLVTPDYQTPMKGELLWVYEGLTQYYGVMLAARSGMMPSEMFREYIASTTAALDHRPGRYWRDLQDTAVAAQILYSGSPEGASWRRSIDFYDEGLLIWLEADTIIRKQSNGRKSLDDFCRKFHGGENTGARVVPYTFDDVVAGLNELADLDWRGFFGEHLKSHGPAAPLAGIENSGWRLAFSEVPNDYEHVDEVTSQQFDFQFSLGFLLHGTGGEDGDRILDVIPGSPAAVAGLSPGMRLVAVNGRKWSPEILRDAIKRAKNSKDAIGLLAENGDFFATYHVDYHGGERYPHLELITGKSDLLSEIARPKAAPVPLPAND